MSAAIAEKMLAAVKVRISENTERTTMQLGINAHRKALVRLNESTEVLGILRKVLKDWEMAGSRP